MRRRGHISEVNLDALADICGGVTWPYPGQPPRDAAARRLLETLGVVGVPEAAVAVTTKSREASNGIHTAAGELSVKEQVRRHHEFLDSRTEMTARCGVDGCGWVLAGPTGDVREAQRDHAATHPRLTKRQRTQAERATQARAAAADLSRSLQARETSAARAATQGTEDTSVTTEATWSRKPISREEALAQMTATLAHLPAPPTRNGWAKGKLRPSINAVERIFGSYGDALNACGHGTALAEREPKAGEAPVPAAPPTAEREPVRSAAVVSKPVPPPELPLETASRSANTDPKEPPMGETILQEAERIINGDRRTDYGDVRDSFQTIADLWRPVLGADVTPEQVAVCMIQLKVARALNGYQRDSLVDIAGYAGCLAHLRGIA